MIKINTSGNITRTEFDGDDTEILKDLSMIINILYYNCDIPEELIKAAVKVGFNEDLLKTANVESKEELDDVIKEATEDTARKIKEMAETE